MTENDLREIKKESDKIYNDIMNRRQIRNVAYICFCLVACIVMLGLIRC